MNTVDHPSASSDGAQSAKTAEWPSVSAVLPIRNEANYIEDTLMAILQQDYPADRLEIVIADGQSDDNTRDIIASISAKYPNRIRLYDNPKRIMPTGINIAIRQAKGDIISPVSGHCMLDPDYIRNSVECLQRTGADNAGGPMRAINKGFFAEAIAYATNSPFGVGNSRFHYSEKEEWVDSVYQGSYRREVFDKIGYFDEELVRDQDDEFNYRLGASGGRILLSPTITSRYYSRSSYKKLFRQYYQYGYYKVRVMQKLPKMVKPRHLIPAVFSASAIVSLLLFAINPKLFYPVPIAVLGSYAAVMALGSLILASKNGWKYLFALFPAFFCLHFGYGLGTLHGLWVFRNRWRGAQYSSQ